MQSPEASTYRHVATARPGSERKVGGKSQRRARRRREAKNGRRSRSPRDNGGKEKVTGQPSAIGPFAIVYVSTGEQRRLCARPFASRALARPAPLPRGTRGHALAAGLGAALRRAPSTATDRDAPESLVVSRLPTYSTSRRYSLAITRR